MATLDIQGIKVNCETSKHLTEYRIEMHFKTPETDEDMINSIDFYVSHVVDSRSDLTFDQVEELVNYEIEDMGLEIIEISNLKVKEVNTFKKSEYQDGENYT